MNCKGAGYTPSAAPGASFTAHTGSGRTVSFNASGSGAGIAQYVWQFNDGPGQTTTVKTTSPTISHTFPSAAVYKVALTTMAGNGRSRGTAKAVDVKPPVIGSATIQAGQTVRSIINNGFKISSH